MANTPFPAYRGDEPYIFVCYAHDENNECGLGDRGVIMETRPMSKLKRFRVLEVLKKAPVIG